MEDAHSILAQVYPACQRMAGPETWARLLSMPGALQPGRLPELIAGEIAAGLLPGFLADLSALEWTRQAVASAAVLVPERVETRQVNPSLELLSLSWKVTHLLGAERPTLAPVAEPEWVVVWRHPQTGRTLVEPATPDRLLALKMLADGIAPFEAAAAGGVSVTVVDAALRRAAEDGIVLTPRSLIRRDTSAFPAGTSTSEDLIEATSFTVQWHITNKCDLHCKHCYDRTRRSPLTLEQGLKVLDDLDAFCRSRFVSGHVCFSGGNPLLSPLFFDLYAAATERGFATALLGNPAPRHQIERLIGIQKPEFFQVSLEGLPDHNDRIRGPGFFERVIAFLHVLEDLDVSSSVMLTLTKGNMDQVLPLGERLRDLTDHFTFNRLSPVGEGASLAMPSRDPYPAFLRAYVDASAQNPILGYKDNLLNVVFHERGRSPAGGCTGFGCGAAFNFVAILPDGEVHACRKFPSPIGNILNESLSAIYASDAAGRYRQGCSACDGCALRPVCGGCLAIAAGHKLDCFSQRDPYCFIG